MLTVYSSCKLKTRQDERQVIKLPLETIAFYSDSFVARKINVEQKVAENWAPYCSAVALYILGLVEMNEVEGVELYWTSRAIMGQRGNLRALARDM